MLYRNIWYCIFLLLFYWKYIIISMENRIEYLDILRGLCMVWIIWYHTEHPEFVNYPFFNTTLFFVSGIFFRTYSWDVFYRKKLNRMVIPLLFFYLLYYIFLLFINYIKYHQISTDIANTCLLYTSPSPRD